MRLEWVKINGIQLPTKCLYTRRINGFYVPCGKCSWCRKRLAREWSFRVTEEAKDKYVYNCLLTYDDVHLPYYDGKPTVNYVHVQLFLKRFRERLRKKFGCKVSFFCVGEYGGQTHRPHYHILFFSEKKLEISYSDFKNNPEYRGQPYDPLLYVFKELDAAWSYGYCDIEPMTDVGKMCHYMVAYLMSYHDGIRYNKHNRPFRQMSRRPAIGSRYMERNKEFLDHCVKNMKYTYSYAAGKHAALPRYYKRKIMPEEQAIAFADAYYESSQRFTLFISTLDYHDKQFFQNKLFNEITREKRQQKEEYNKHKVHNRPGRLAGSCISKRKRL